MLKVCFFSVLSSALLANVLVSLQVQARPLSGVCSQVNWIPLDSQVYNLKPIGSVKATNGGTDWQYFTIDNDTGYRPDYPIRFNFDVQDNDGASHFHLDILAVGDIPKDFNDKKYVISVEHQDGTISNLSYFGIGECRMRTEPQDSLVGTPKSVKMFEVKKSERTLI